MRGLLASPLGFLIGISLGALGGGGSILAVPALVYGAGQGAKDATTTSLLVVGLTSLLGMASYWRAGRVRLREGLVFGAVGVGGSLIGSQLNKAVDPDLLLLAFAGIMVIAAWRMWGSASRAGGAAPRSVGAAAATVAPRVDLDAATMVKVAAAGTLVGFLTGFFGVGGGFVIVPALVLALRFPMPEAVATSLLVIAINAAFALTQRLSSTPIEWRVALPFLAAGLLGAVTGRRLADRLPTIALTRWFVALLLAVAAYTAVRSAIAL